MMPSLCHFRLKQHLVMNHHQWKGISLRYSHTKKSKGFNISYRDYCNLKKYPPFFKHPVYESFPDAQTFLHFRLTKAEIKQNVIKKLKKGLRKQTKILPTWGARSQRSNRYYNRVVSKAPFNNELSMTLRSASL